LTALFYGIVSTSGYLDDVLVVDLVDESMLELNATREENRGQSPVKKQSDSIFPKRTFHIRLTAEF
jgi:hypothetical protein